MKQFTGIDLPKKPTSEQRVFDAMADAMLEGFRQARPGFGTGLTEAEKRALNPTRHVKL